MLFETVNCTGCRTCEIACSYHHSGIFSPAISSIEVKGDPQGLRFSIVLHEQAINGHLACDECGGTEGPFCVKYCNVLARDELRALLKKVTDNRRKSYEKA